MTGHPNQPGDPAEMPQDPPACVRHPDRATGLRCSRCDRPACPACLREASVGYQCVDCVRGAARTMRRPMTIAGASLRAKPVVVPVLIVVNVAIFLVTVVQAGSISNVGAALFQQWALVPALVATGDWWRLLTSAFLHIGLVHLAFNMIALWVIGRDLEIMLGRLRFAIVYLVSLLGGGVAVLLFGALGGPVAGASGAVFGLMGGVAVAAVRLRLNPGPALLVIAINVFLSFSIPGISLLGHLGGLAVGAAATAGMIYPPAKTRTQWQVITIAGLVVVLGLLAYLRIDALTSLAVING